jgi:hypothetical protein
MNERYSSIKRDKKAFSSLFSLQTNVVTKEERKKESLITGLFILRISQCDSDKKNQEL